jgi:NADH-quinone oxidoreductase subunit G
MIDVCPVGALTSKPFRYAARTWELARRKSISPHDGLGSNLVVQVRGDRVKRVLPLENEAVNECWISDKDRFSYTALDSAGRLEAPMVKQGGEWKRVDWPTALEFVAHGLKDVAGKHGGDAIGALVSPHATLEELALAGELMRGLGSDNIDHRLRRTDFRGDRVEGGVPWLGMPIAEVGRQDRVLVVGSFLRKDQPLLAQRLRQAAKRGTRVMVVNPVDDDWLLPVAARAIVAPSLMPLALAELVVAATQAAGKPVPGALSTVVPGDAAKAIAAQLAGGERRAIFLGNLAQQHPQASELHALAQALAEATGATLGFLTEAANSVGAELARARPQGGGRNAAQLAADPRRAYVVLHAEPEFDCADPVGTRAALEKAELVVVMSPFRHGETYADVLLPIAPFTETSGTFVNCEGRAQSFRGAVAPLAETRPAWKVLRVLGTMLGLAGFDLESSEEVRDRIVPGRQVGAERLSNATGFDIATPATAAAGIERAADVPIHFADPIVRRAPPLQETADARAPKARMHRTTLERFGVAEGAQVRIVQGHGSAVLAAAVDPGVPPGVVRVAAAHPSTCGLQGLSGPVTVERA